MEDAEDAASENRPRRRMYSVTAQGRKAFELSRAGQPLNSPSEQKGWAIQ
jgi:DNA-binding PadR family transcriptional regulator